MRRLTDDQCRALVEDDSNLAVLALELMARLAEGTDPPVWERPPLLDRLEAER